MHITGNGLPFAVWPSGKGSLIFQEPGSRGCTSASSKQSKGGQGQYFGWRETHLRLRCRWTRAFQKSGFAFMCLVVTMRLCCGNNQEKALVKKLLPLTSCKRNCNRTTLRAIKDQLQHHIQYWKLHFLTQWRWSPCNFSHMDPKIPDALRSWGHH